VDTNISLTKAASFLDAADWQVEAVRSEQKCDAGD
jgi:hypothetical protein